MSISRAWVGTRSLPESYFDTHANRGGYNNSVQNQKLILLPLFFVLLRVCLGYIYHSVSPMLYQPRSINLTVHLICFSQSTRSARLLKNTFFPLHFQTHSCGFQIVRDWICAAEMSRTILNLINGWDGTLPPEKKTSDCLAIAARIILVNLNCYKEEEVSKETDNI